MMAQHTVQQKMHTVVGSKQQKNKNLTPTTCVLKFQKNMLPPYPLSYGVPVWERYGSTLLPATREQPKAGNIVGGALHHKL